MLGKKPRAGADSRRRCFSSLTLLFGRQGLERKASIVKRRKGGIGEVRLALVAV